MIILKIIFWLAVFLLGYSYVVYPIILILIDKLFKSKQFRLSDDLPGVSIIIAAYNEEKVIQARIENCLGLDYPKDKLEIIIASDGSDDRTNDIVRPFAAQGVVLYDYQQRRGKVNVLNETIPKAKYDIVLFSDANTMFKVDAVKKLVRYFGDEKVACVVGALEFVSADGSRTGELEGFYWRYETMMKKREGRRGSLLGANGAIYALRKELYEHCPADTIVEDFFIPMRLLNKGYYVVYEPRANAIEEAAHKIVHEKQRRIRIGAGDFQALFRLGPMLNPFKGFSAFAFWSHKVLRWFAPFFLIIAFILNGLLLGEAYYKVWFGLQILFYMSALIGQILSWADHNVKFFNLCYYFVSMNMALFLGFIRFVTNTQNVKWKRTER
ncbi:MAG: glycosyltransferase family 2 protein [Candidatus Omnitrophica bacterium]|nr:glycosyltransferase family 2 protein [Candidatus Omnitrophota bacterium]